MLESPKLYLLNTNILVHMIRDEEKFDWSVKSMAINELSSLVAPPESPIATGSSKKWKAVETKLGTLLPKDYYDYAATYGSGSFKDVGRLRLSIYNPFSENFEDQVRMHSDLLTGLKIGEGNNFIPFEVFPSLPGLLACGIDDNGNELYWLTQEKPANWSMVVRSHENTFERFNDQLTAFLSKLFKGQIRNAIWPEPFFTDINNIHFEPEDPSCATATVTKNLYELYVENGDSAGFWVRRDDSQPGVRYFIRLIDGKSNGPLPGIPTEYGRPPVTGDLYLNEKLFEKDLDLTSAYQRVFSFFEPR